MFEEISTFVANIGFPIAVAFYLLLRIENKLDSLTTAISKLATKIE